MDFAQVAIESGHATPVQIRDARREQARLRREGRSVFLAEVLVQRGVVSSQQLLSLLHLGRGYHERPLDAPGAQFGDLAVAKGYITPVQLFCALQEQRDDAESDQTHRARGEVLVERGWLAPWELEDVLVTMVDLQTSTDRTGETPTEAFKVGELFARDEDDAPAPAHRYPRAIARRAAAAAIAPAADLVSHVMSLVVTAVPIEARVAEALDAAIQDDTDTVLVLHHEELLGVLSVWDLRELDQTMPVARCMSPAPGAVGPNSRAVDAAVLLRDERVGCVPVRDGRQVVGVVERASLRHLGVGLWPWEEVPETELGGGG